MPAPTHNVVCDRNAGFRLNFTLRNPDGTPINTTSLTLWMEVRDEYGSPVALLSFKSPQYTTFGGANGKVNILVPAAITKGLKPGERQYDVMIAESGDERVKVLRGTFKIEDSITLLTT